METSKKFFDYELALLMNFKGFTFCNFTHGSLGQKCYYFFYSEESIEAFNARAQGSFIFSVKKPTNASPFSFSKIDNNELVIIDWSESNHLWQD